MPYLLASAFQRSFFVALPCWIWMSAASADGLEVDTVRSGLIYSIGSVERVANNSAVIDLGDVHTLKPEEQVAVFRPTSSYYVPVGLARIAMTHPSHCQSHPAPGNPPRAGDIVIFVREFSQMQTADRHSDQFLKQQIVKNAGANSYATGRRRDTVSSLLNYQNDQPKWERSKSSVIGYLNGETFAEGGQKSVKTLLNHVNIFREEYRIGRNSVPAAGADWAKVMNVLYGPTATAQHEAAQRVPDEDEPAGENTGPSLRDVQRAIGERLFDRTTEEQHLLSFLVATVLEQPPRRFDLWMTQRVEQSQFPELANEDVVLDVVRDIVREIRDKK